MPIIIPHIKLDFISIPKVICICTLCERTCRCKRYLSWEGVHIDIKGGCKICKYCERLVDKGFLTPEGIYTKLNQTTIIPTEIISKKEMESIEDVMNKIEC